MSNPRQPPRALPDTEKVLIHHMQLELATTPASLNDMAKLLALNYFSAVPDPALRTVTMHDWRGLDEREADNAKASNLKRLQRYLDGTTAIPAALLWPWLNCLEATREDCLAAIAAQGGLVFVDVGPGRHNTTLCASMRHFAEVIDHNADILRDGMVDANDKAAVEAMSATVDKLMASLEGFRRHLQAESGLADELASLEVTVIGRAAKALGRERG